MHYLFVLTTVLWLFAGCQQVSVTTPVAAEPVQPQLAGTPTPLPTPTLAPTVVPGTTADEQAAMAVVQQFAEALTRDDEIVALLMLSPSAQQIVASSDLHSFMGGTERPSSLKIQSLALDRDVAIASGVAHYPHEVVAIRIRLVRLDGQWKIDARVNE